jgi:anti-sigma factor RsiW
MQGESEANHAAIAAWLDGSLSPAQRQEFEAHLATCVDCQAEVTAQLKTKIPARTEATVSIKPELPRPTPRKRARVLWIILIGAVLIVVVGYALGWWAWDLANG